MNINTILEKNTFLIKNKLLELGFNSIGISKVEYLNEDRKRLENWLQNGYHGNLCYMEKYIEERSNPALLVENAKSIISVILNYYPSILQKNSNIKISKYAYGKDYHYVIKEKLFDFLKFIKLNIGEVNGRGFVDSAPIFEKTWAAKSGLGWVGKNGNLIQKQRGSFFFIANIIVDLQLIYDNYKIYDYCGKCTKCIDACPTSAILPNKVINAKQCISYYTIELKEHLKNNDNLINTNDWLFGCDICQDVCPWNKFSKPTIEKDFEPIEEIINFEIKDWLNLNKKEFNKLFKKSALKRAKFEGIKSNLNQLIIQ